MWDALLPPSSCAGSGWRPPLPLCPLSLQLCKCPVLRAVLVQGQGGLLVHVTVVLLQAVPGVGQPRYKMYIKKQMLVVCHLFFFFLPTQSF